MRSCFTFGSQMAVGSLQLELWRGQFSLNEWFLEKRRLGVDLLIYNNSWSRILLEKLTVVYVISKFCVLYGTENSLRYSQEPPLIPMLSQTNPHEKANSVVISGAQFIQCVEWGRGGIPPFLSSRKISKLKTTRTGQHPHSRQATSQGRLKQLRGSK